MPRSRSCRIFCIFWKVGNMKDAETARHELFFNRVPEMLCVAGFDGYFRELNPEWEKTLGFTAGELLKIPRPALFHPDDAAAARLAEARVLAGDPGVLFETRCRCKDGSYKWLSWRCSADPEKSFFYASARDITARKMTETAIRESEAALRKIMDLAPMSMAIVNLDGTIEYINRKAEQTFGYSHTEIPSMDRWWALAYPDEAYRKEVVERWMGRVHRAFAEKTEIDGGEYTVTCKDGTVKNVFIFGVIAADKVFVMFDDITLRLRAEQALRESETTLRRILDNAPMAMAIQNMDGRIEYINNKFTQTFGYSREDVPDLESWARQAYPDEAYRKELLAHWADLADKAVRTKTEMEGGEYKVVCKDGSEKKVFIFGVVAAGKVICMLDDVTARAEAEAARRKSEDETRLLNCELEQRVRQRTAELTAANQDLLAEIAHRREAELARQKLREELIQSQKMEALGRLAGGIAHDFNNILVAISGYAEFLMNTMPAGAPARDDLAEIRLETERGAALTRQLLTLSRKQELQTQLVDVNKVADEAEKMLRRIIGANMRLEKKLGAGPALINADPTQISQVIMNLVINARDAMPDGGRIAIETGNASIGADAAGMKLAPNPGEYVLLSVSDTGTGMSAEVMSHIFEPFYTTKAPGAGTGLGLSTVYGIVNQACGGISVESEPGRGSAFKIYFPKAA